MFKFLKCIVQRPRYFNPAMNLLIGGGMDVGIIGRKTVYVALVVLALHGLIVLSVFLIQQTPML